MRILSRFGGPIITIIVVGVCIFALKTAPSMLWPERSRSLVKDEGFQAGHQTIGINERALERDSQTLLFSLLKKWRYDRERPAPPPERVREYDGRFVRIVGFMYPLESGREISTFCLLRSTQTCCYGPRPPALFVYCAQPRPVAMGPDPSTISMSWWRWSMRFDSSACDPFR